MSAILDAFSTFARDLFLFALAWLGILWATCWTIDIWQRMDWAMPLWFRRILLGLLAVIVAQQIYAHTLGAIYGSRCSAPDQHWWGTFWICTANAQR